jgi:hypothetical protein
MISGITKHFMFHILWISIDYYFLISSSSSSSSYYYYMYCCISKVLYCWHNLEPNFVSSAHLLHACFSLRLVILDQYFVKRTHYWASNLQLSPFSSDFRAFGYKYTPPKFSQTHSVLCRRVSESRTQECQLSFVKHNFFRQESEGTAGCVLLVSKN